ncbi:hypothetical protein [Pseudomonas fluorescens]|uniref:Uncharacterized protein n=1 Tax=Pseudomonas fluorescens TaxID=294 RepID=A0A5E7P2D9_PSEFL|nr:hypothetical protein [Pseudomonas fluorescens]VVP43521.1 hypothetical protein PS880_04971 [Pseudomonas fluorescens]
MKKNCLPLLLVAVAPVLAFAGPVEAPPVIVPNTPVNTNTPGMYDSVDVIPLHDGGWLVAWFSPDQDADWNVYQQRYAGSGAKVGLETQVNTHTPGSQTNPAVTALADGGWVVAWDSHGQDGSEVSVYQQRYAASGTKKGDETKVNTYTTGEQSDSAIAALADGGWVVTWTRYKQNGKGFGVYQQRYAESGAKAGVETQVNSTIADSQGASDVTALASGGWVVTWMGGSGSDRKIYQQRYAESGAKAGVETQVNSTTTGKQGRATVRTLADGGWLVTWYRQNGANDDVYQQRYAGSGAKVGVETQFNSTMSGSVGIPAVTARADGGWVVTLMGKSGSDNNIYQQRYVGSGAKVGVETQVNSTTDGDQYDPAITTLEDDGWIVIWINRSGIYQQRYDAVGNPLGG